MAAVCNVKLTTINGVISRGSIQCVRVCVCLCVCVCVCVHIMYIHNIIIMHKAVSNTLACYK